MPRKKKNNIDKENINNDSNEFVYCGLIKCIHTECLRHNVNTPYNKIILRRKFNPDKDWNCEDMEV